MSVDFLSPRCQIEVNYNLHRLVLKYLVTLSNGMNIPTRTTAESCAAAACQPAWVHQCGIGKLTGTWMLWVVVSKTRIVCRSFSEPESSFTFSKDATTLPGTLLVNMYWMRYRVMWGCINSLRPRIRRFQVVWPSIQKNDTRAVLRSCGLDSITFERLPMFPTSYLL